MVIDFIRKQSGSVLPMAAIVMFAIVGVSAGTIEYAKFSEMRKEAQKVVDAAAIIGATRSAKAAEDFVRAQFDRIRIQGSRIEAVKVQVDELARVDLKFTAISMFERIGLDDTAITVSASAAPPSQLPVDVVLALDYSGSMGWDNRYLHMRTAAHSFLDSFENEDGLVRVGLVPFGSHTMVAMDGAYLFDSVSSSALAGSFYLACVSNRGYPHAVQIATPDRMIEESMWPTTDFARMNLAETGGDWSPAQTGDPNGPRPWSYDDPDDAVYTATVSADGEAMYRVDFSQLDGSPNGYGWTLSWPGKCRYESAWRLGFCGPHASITDASIPPNEGFSSNNLATHRSAENLAPACKDYYDRNLLTRPLTKDLNGLKAEITAMSPAGATNIALAFDTAWHLVSGNRPWTENANATDTEKIAILLSDGVQTVPAHGSGNEYSISAANRNTKEICDAMKDSEVTVYTIAFGLADTFTKDLLAGCATSPSHFFTPEAGESLETTFLEIARSLKTPARIVR